MLDNFALLNQPRLPWIEPEELKQVFHKLSSDQHPDRSHHGEANQILEAGRNFAEINAAYNCLREPKDRLRHLLQLERGEKPSDIQNVPSGLMEWQFKFADVCRAADQLIASNPAKPSPLMKVEMFRKAQEQMEILGNLRQQIIDRRSDLYAELKSMNSTWSSLESRELTLNRLEEIYRLLGYFHRWTAQLQDRITQLQLQNL